GQRIINVLDGQTIEFYINNTPINLTTCTLEHLEREMDLAKGITIRKARYRTSEGNVFTIKEQRLISLVQKELFIIKISLQSENYTGPLKVISKLQLPATIASERKDSRINQATEKQLLIKEKVAGSHGVALKAVTTSTKLELGCGMTHSLPLIYYYGENGFEGFTESKIKSGQTFEIIKYLVYTPSMIYENVLESNASIMDDVIENGFDHYLEIQESHLENFWKNTGLKIIGDEDLDQMVQYNMFQLYTSANDDARFSIPAKGLTGEGYEGHYFWDTEIYMVPFFTLTNPSLAKQLLLYRYNHINEARVEAKNQGVDKGIKIPWRTINGKEASPYYAAGSAQFHINSDVAYTLIKYYEYTGDIQFMIDYGFELLLETARFLYAAGNEHDGRFHINSVTGPDEYTTMVDDNYYTNTMAKYHFEFVYRFYNQNKSALRNICVKLKANDHEIDALQVAASRMYTCFDSHLNIFAQDNSFLQKPELDFKALPEDKFPLLLHYHPTFIYRHQVLKQADVLLSMFLLDYDNMDIFNSSFDYYLKRTTHDSSLSKCIHSIVAFRLGHVDLGYEFLNEIVRMDMENTHKNTHHGLHIANSGGIYLAMTYGVLGLR
ncbi:MAG TPA: family 65 glycosyl hydrolase, partial [Bacillota bacterium]|nr:family 65 glycosyl hydrolase [Bacillota bacterium]